MNESATLQGSVQPRDWFRELGRFLAISTAIVVGIYGVWRIRAILEDTIVAAIIAVALGPAVDMLCRIRVGRTTYRTRRFVATVIVFLAVIAVIVEAVSLIIRPFEISCAALAHEWLAVRQDLPNHESRAMAWVGHMQQMYATLPIGVRQYMSHQGAGASAGGDTGGWFQAVLGGAAAGIAKIVDLIVLPVLSFYFILDGRSLRNEFAGLVPAKRRRETLKLFREASQIMHTFVVAQFWLCTIAGVVVYIGLERIGLGRYAPVLGLLAGVTRAIPIIGPVIAGIPIIGVALVVSGPIAAVKVLIFFSIMHLVESKLIMPKFIGHRIHLHAALVILVLLVGYEFFGLIGMFLAAPVAAYGRFLVQTYIVARRRRTAAERAAAPVPHASLYIKAE